MISEKELKFHILHFTINYNEKLGAYQFLKKLI